MRKIYFYFLLLCLLVSCSPSVKYLGQANEPTNDVDVFVAEQSIERPYKIVGSGHLGFAFRANIEKVQKKIVNKGKTIGADAVLITYYSIPTGGTTINTESKTDSVARGSATTINTSIQPSYASGYNIVYLKYK